MNGRIIKGIAGFYYVITDDEVTYACKAKGLFRKDGIKPLVGDFVEFDVTHEGDKEGNITSINARSNQLIRPAVANIDFMLVIFSVKDPEPNLYLLDKFLVYMDLLGIKCEIVINKCDLDEGDFENIDLIYSKAGYAVHKISALEGSGISDIRNAIKGKVVSVAGPSGVGKSTFINDLIGDEYMSTGDVSEKIKRGKHTTRHTELIDLGDNTYIADTPGFSSLYIEGVEPEELDSYFIEFEKYYTECKYRDCMHLKEDGCAVKAALEKGDISSSRYESYQMLIDEINSSKKY